jgi:hypothetical protein
VRIYADFNAVLDSGGPGRPGLVRLDRLGTVRDLCAAGITLRAGLALTLYTDSDERTDLQVEAVVRWHPDAKAEAGGYWVGVFDPASFRDVPVAPSLGVFSWFPCSGCGVNLAPQIARSGISASSTCEECGTRTHSPVRPPEAGA